MPLSRVPATLLSGQVPDANIATMAASKLTGQVMPQSFPSGSIIGVSVVRNSTRTSMPTTNTHIAFSGTFNKILSSSIIIATSTVFGAPFQSGNCGVGMRLNSTWDFGCAYQYDGAWGSSQTTIIVGTGRWTDVPAGTNTMNWGWQTVNGSASDKPFSWLNPNSNDDARNQQKVSSIIIYEVIT
jgi:hypothetical protein